MNRSWIAASVVSISLVAGASLQADAALLPPVQLHSAEVSGHAVNVLAASDGHTLYYFTEDTHGLATCTGSCAKLWPPLLSKGIIAPNVRGIPGKFQAVKGPNGLQVDYNGHPLYLYSLDVRPGEALGNGLFGGIWWVAKPNLSVQAINAGANTKPAVKKSSGW